MKILKFIFFSLLALCLIVCTAVFIFFQTFDTDQYLPQIAKKASLALGRPVSIGHVCLGLSLQGITLDAAPVIIADDPGFTSQPFIKVDRIRMSVGLRVLVLAHKIHITRVLLQSPQVHFIRSLDGVFNARSLGQVSPPAGDNAAAGGTVMNTVDSIGSASKENSPKKDISLSIKIQDGSISFIDQGQSLLLDIWLKNINASLKDISLSRPFRLSFDGSLYGNEPNVNVNALVSLDPSERTVTISGLSLRTDFSRLDTEAFKGISPSMPDSATLKNVKGLLQLNMPHLEIGGAGHFEANGNIMISKGLIKNFNIIKVVLSRTLGVMTGGMESYIDKLGVNDTVVEKAQAQFSYHDKTLFIDNSLVKTNIFEFTAKGSLDAGFNMDMQTMLHLDTGVSAALVNEFDGARFFYDDTNRIAIGASLKGIFPHLKYKPDKDFKKKSKKAWEKAGGDILGVLLGGR